RVVLQVVHLELLEVLRREDLPIPLAHGHVQPLRGRRHVEPPVERSRTFDGVAATGEQVKHIGPVDYAVGRRLEARQTQHRREEVCADNRSLTHRPWSDEVRVPGDAGYTNTPLVHRPLPPAQAAG